MAASPRCNGVPAADAKVDPGARWALSGDRGITYAATPPPGTRITEGEWWPANYQGPTLISFDGDLAQGLGLKLGDTMTLNVLGREIPGKIVNFRHVDFSNGNQNFILILSPGLIDKAPHSFLATVRVDPQDEEPMYRAVTDKFPSVSTVRVKDAIAQVNGLLQQLSEGVRAASLLTILAGLLVLAGAIAAGQRARLYDSTVLKVLGATRRADRVRLCHRIWLDRVGDRLDRARRRDGRRQSRDGARFCRRLRFRRGRGPDHGSGRHGGDARFRPHRRLVGAGGAAGRTPPPPIKIPYSLQACSRNVRPVAQTFALILGTRNPI